MGGGFLRALAWVAPRCGGVGGSFLRAVGVVAVEGAVRVWMDCEIGHGRGREVATRRFMKMLSLPMAHKITCPPQVVYLAMAHMRH